MRLVVFYLVRKAAHHSSWNVRGVRHEHVEGAALEFLNRANQVAETNIHRIRSEPATLPVPERKVDGRPADIRRHACNAPTALQGERERDAPRSAPDFEHARRDRRLCTLLNLMRLASRIIRRIGALSRNRAARSRLTGINRRGSLVPIAILGQRFI